MTDLYDDIKGLDRTIHEPTRLAIIAILNTVESADFTYLQNALSLTQGNLAGHLRKMEEAGYVAIYKSFVGRRPNTSYSLTSTGQEAFNTYREKIKEIGARLG